MRAISFSFTAARDQPRKADGVQLAEIALRAKNGTAIRVATVRNPGGVHPSPFQVPARVADGNLQTKWFDANFSSVGRSRLELWLEHDESVHSVELFTANDNPRRDPVAFFVGVLRPVSVRWAPNQPKPRS
jgi:hypothetical protein